MAGRLETLEPARRAVKSPRTNHTTKLVSVLDVALAVNPNRRYLFDAPVERMLRGESTTPRASAATRPGR
jgi:hypothetical protein